MYLAPAWAGPHQTAYIYLHALRLFLTALACFADVNKHRLVMSAKKRSDPSVLGPKWTQWITGNELWISLQPNWQINNPLVNRSIMASAQILVHRWGPSTSISVLFRRQSQPEVNFHLWRRRYHRPTNIIREIYHQPWWGQQKHHF